MAAFLVQIANGNREGGHRRNFVEGYRDHDLIRPIAFNRSNRLTFDRHGDTIKKLLFNIRVGAAPAGWQWRKNWYVHFFDNISLVIGGQIVLHTNTKVMQMQHLVHGQQVAKELTFGYDSHEEEQQRQEKNMRLS